MQRASRDMILWFFMALFILSLFLLGKLFWPFLPVTVLALVVTGIFHPVYKFIGKKIPPSYAAFLTCILIFFTLFIPIVFFVSILAKEAHDLIIFAKSADVANQITILLETNNVLERVNTLLIKFDTQLTYSELVQPISDFGKFLGIFLLNQAKSITSHLVTFLINFCLMLMIAYYLLIDGKRLIGFIVNLSPLPNDQDIMLVEKFRNMGGAVLIGNGISGILQGIVGSIVFAIYGLHSPILWGVIMAFLAFLPILGIGIVFLGAALFLFLKGNIAGCIGIIVIYIILSGGVEYLLKPVLVGKKVKMHTLLVFLSIIGGLYLFGILGIIYGPLIVTFFLTLTDIYNTNYRMLVDSDQNSDNTIYNDLNMI